MSDETGALGKGLAIVTPLPTPSLAPDAAPITHHSSLITRWDGHE
jgi:hypothetical protein